jgi:hypothetical protein
MTSPQTLPDHLLLMPGDTAGRWGVWRTLCVRAAGFPAADVLKIADSECAAAADRLAAVEAESEALRQKALEAIRGELEGAPKERLDVLVKAIRKVKRQQPAKTEGLAAATGAAIDAWQAAAGRVAAEKERYQAAFAAADERLDRVLREAASSERFHEAVIWQNHHAAETGLGAFLRRSPGERRTSARDRGHAQMLASYLQRYCIKNDTIGFFGPVGWGRISESPTTVTERPGQSLLASRQVFLEGWAMDAVADKLAEDEAMRQWLSPKRSPYLRQENASTWVSPAGPIQFGPLSSRFIAGCDGTRSVRAMIRELGPDLTPDKEVILWGMLNDFHAKGILRLGFQIPMTPTPEVVLRKLLLEVEDEPLRERALAVVDEIIAKRDAVQSSAGSAEGVERTLRDLEETFTRITGSATTRADGQLYAGRTIVYEDCRRDLDLEFGAPFLNELSPALSLVLASARWYTHYAATSDRDILKQLYSELSTQAGGAQQVDFLAFTRLAMPRLVNKVNHAQFQHELRSRWERILNLPEGQRRVSYRSEDLLPRVREEFSAPAPGWQKARYHSPDILIAAASAEAIRQGDYQVILGEVHAAINTLDRWIFFCQHTDPDSLRAAIQSDLPEPSVIPTFPKAWNLEAVTKLLGVPLPSVNGRMDHALHADKDYYLDFALDAIDYPRSQVLNIADLVVETGGEHGLVVGPRGSTVRFDVIDFYQVVMLIQGLEAFRVMPGGTYTPRITIDRLVVARESWVFPAEELAFASAATPAERFAAVRQWAAGHGLPRFLFAKTQLEQKPFYLDLDSPVLVEILAKSIRRAEEAIPGATVGFSEMLPNHEQLWLPDAQDNRYTCELRVVTLDLD